MITTPDETVVDQNTAQDTAEPASLAARPAFQAPILSQRIIPHHPKAGLNPLADGAAYIFSVIGKLKQLKSYRHLSKLHQELIEALQVFQSHAKAQGYSSEHILISRYILCATLDDLIQNTSWGKEGKWDQYSLIMAFHPDTINPDRFFIIMERVIKEPALYIDILELMYISLSLGFEGPYRSNDYNRPQLEQITQGLYQQIRAYRGDFHKNLSPYVVRANKPPQTERKSSSVWLVLFLMSCFIVAIMSGLGYSLGTMITQIDQDLTQIGKSILYETHD